MFWDEIKRHYDAGSAHQFLLHFNVNDLLYDDVYGYLRTTDYLMAQLNLLGCQLVLGYNTAEGIHFPRWVNGETHREPLRFSHSTTKQVFFISRVWRHGFKPFNALERLKTLISPNRKWIRSLCAKGLMPIWRLIKNMKIHS